jgi:hypothetical protein
MKPELESIEPRSPCHEMAVNDDVSQLTTSRMTEQQIHLDIQVSRTTARRSSVFDIHT